MEDSTPPETTITTGPTGVTRQQKSSFSFSSNEPGSTFRCALDSTDDSAFTNCTSPFETSTLADGGHTFYVKAADPSGNEDATPASRSFSVDTTGPEISLADAPGAWTSDDTLSVSFSSPEANATFACQVVSSEAEIGVVHAANPCSSPYEPPALDDGEYTLEIYAYDELGNPTARYESFTLDTVGPTVAFTSLPDSLTREPSPELAFDIHGLQPGDQVHCWLHKSDRPLGLVNREFVEDCSSPYAPTLDGDGEYRVVVGVSDVAGHQDFATRDFVLDRTAHAPGVGFSEGTSFDTARPRLEFWAGPDQNDEFNGDYVFECRIDGSSPEPCQATQLEDPTGAPVYAGGHTPGAALANGNHTFAVRYTDAAGNVSAWASGSFTVAAPAEQNGGGGEQSRGADGDADAGGGSARSRGAATIAGPTAGKARLGRKGTLRVPGTLVQCPPDGAACAVTATTTGKAGRARLGFGSATFSVEAGRSGAVAIRVPKKARAALKRARRAKLAITITARADTEATTKTVNVTLKAPRRR